MFFFASPGNCSIYLNKTFTYKCYLFFSFVPFGLQVRLFQEKYPLPSPRRMGFGRFSWGGSGGGGGGGGGGAFSTGGGVHSVCFFLQKPFCFLFGTNLHTGNVWMDGWIHKHTYKTVHPKQLGRSWG